MLGAATSAEQNVSSNYLSYIIGGIGVSLGRRGETGVVGGPPTTLSSQCAIKSCAVNEIRRGTEVVLQLAAKRRSRCGVLRGWPVPSSHFSPGFAPHVGQRIANIRLARTSFFFMRARLCQRKGANTVQFCTPWKTVLGSQFSESGWERLSPHLLAGANQQVCNLR
jgi:hypothetical protein